MVLLGTMTRLHAHTVHPGNPLVVYASTDTCATHILYVLHMAEGSHSAKGIRMYVLGKGFPQSKLQQLSQHFSAH